MCWTSTTTPVKKIASEDFVVYKTLIDGKFSMYYHYPYSLGKLETLPEDIKPKALGSAFEIYRGFHSYRISKAVRLSYYYRLYFNDSFLFILYLEEPEEIYECIIPKGSIYYDNGIGEVVSNKIIVNKRVGVNIFLNFAEKAKSKLYDLTNNIRLLI